MRNWANRAMSHVRWQWLRRHYGTALMRSRLIWPGWYRLRYPDVARSAMDPLAHYIRFGAGERRVPSLLFNGNRYLDDNPDLAESGVNPLLHYVVHGQREGRVIHPVMPARGGAVADGLNRILHHPGVGTPELSIVMPIRNASAFIHASLPSILGQTGCVAEIVISDDRSDDDTLTQAAGIVASYRGPHAVTLFQTPSRLGIDHLATLVETVSQDWIVQAHGDDVSCPHRAFRLLTLHRQTGASLIGSRAVNPDTKLLYPVTQSIAGPGWLPLEAWIKTPMSVLSGALNAFSRLIYSVFPRLDSEYAPVGHDSIQPFRASLLGGVWYTDEVLVGWTSHDGQWSRQLTDPRTLETRSFGFAIRRLGVLRVMRQDLAHAAAAGIVSPQEAMTIGAALDEAGTYLLEQALAAKEKLNRLHLEFLWVPREHLKDAVPLPQPAKRSL